MKTTVPELRAERVVLRGWRESHLALFAGLNADPRVTEHFPAQPTRSQSDAFVRDRIVSHFAERGFGLWTVEVPGVAPFIGFVGLLVPAFETHVTPCVEIGWRLAHSYWGRGYATEAARAAVTFGFTEAGLDEIVSFTDSGQPQIDCRHGETRDELRGGVRAPRAPRPPAPHTRALPPPVVSARVTPLPGAAS